MTAVLHPCAPGAGPCATPRGLSPDHPLIRGTSQNPDGPSRPQPPTPSTPPPAIVKSVMTLCCPHRPRLFTCFDYVVPPSRAC